MPVYPNLLKNTEINGLNQVCASDITYVQLLHENIYLAVILYLYSRKCIGWKLSRNIDRQMAMNALNKAIENRWSESTHELVHHPDQGVEYRSHDYVECLKGHIYKNIDLLAGSHARAFSRLLLQGRDQEEAYTPDIDHNDPNSSNRWTENAYYQKDYGMK